MLAGVANFLLFVWMVDGMIIHDGPDHFFDKIPYYFGTGELFAHLIFFVISFIAAWLTIWAVKYVTD